MWGLSIVDCQLSIRDETDAKAPRATAGAAMLSCSFAPAA